MKNELLNLYGYSERGMVNALCYEMRYSSDGLRLLQEFLNLFSFPFSKPDFKDVRSATFIVEQSFSDFGDLDLLILLDGTKKQAVLLEAKVKTSQTNDWSIASQWAAFHDLPTAVAKTSNLFMQLYRKMRLVRQLKYPEWPLEHSLRMPKLRQSENGVVKAAIEHLREYCSETWLVSLIPDSRANAQSFFQNELPKPITEAPDWDYRTMGFLSWEDLESHLRKEADKWPHSLENFERNKGQIYGQHNMRQKRLPSGSRVTWDSPEGTLTGVVKRNCRFSSRIEFETGMSKKIPNAELKLA